MFKILNAKFFNAKFFQAFLIGACVPFLFTGCGDNSSEGEFEYVAIGASDALGVGASPLTEGYVYEIQEALKADGRDVGLFNLGIPGAESDEIRRAEVPVAIEEEPELITIFVGPNDVIAGISIEDFTNDISGMLADLANETSAVIVIATIPDLTQLPHFANNPDQDVTRNRIIAFNRVITTEAARNGIQVVDLFSQSIRPFQVSDDGFHPSDEGHQFLADQFLSVIRPSLPPVQ